MKKKIIIICSMIVLTGILFLIYCLNNKKEETKIYENTYVEISIINYGKAIIELDSNNAPITVEHFLKLVDSKYYDGLKFNRTITNFMVEVEDNSLVTDKIKGEFIENGVKNNISHLRGVISMRREDNDYNSGSNQFFVLIKDYPMLDGKYAAFGKVVKGIEIFDRVSEIETIPDTNGYIYDNMQPVIEYIKRIDKKSVGDV